MMQEYGIWQAHVKAAKRKGTSTSAYAKPHALPLKSLYRCVSMPGFYVAATICLIGCSLAIHTEGE
jgi:hypothetical protein